MERTLLGILNARRIEEKEEREKVIVNENFREKGIRRVNIEHIVEIEYIYCSMK